MLERRRTPLSVAVVLALLASLLAIVTSAPAATAAVPGNGSAFDCYGNTIYAVQRPSDNPATTGGTIYGLDTTTFGNTTVSATAVTTVPGTANTNALAISKGGATAAVVAQTGGTNSVALYTYDAVNNAWATHTGFAGTNEQFVAGAIDPSRNIYYYATFIAATNKATVYGFDLNTMTAINGVVATVTLPLTTSQTTGVNGDMAFDLGGNLYLVESVTADQKAGVSVVKGQLPATGVNTAITSTQLKSYDLASQQGWNGIAFDNFGRLYIEYTVGANTQLKQLNPNTGETIAGPTPEGLTGSGLAVDLAACSLNPTVSAKTNISSRSVAGDQFTASITGGGITQGNTATTTGAANGVQAEYAGPVIGIQGTTYTLTQTSTTNRLGNYTVTYQCTDAAADDRVVAQGTGSSFSLTVPTPATGSTGPYVTCVFTDTPTPASLTTTKTLTQVNGNAADASTLVKSGDKLTYSITTVNTGGSSGTSTLTDTVPANMTYSGTGEGWSCASSAPAGTACTQIVAPGANGSGTSTVTKTFTTTVGTLPANTATVSNVAQASGATCTSCTATNQTAPVLNTTLQIVTINGAPATSTDVVRAGDVVVYRLTTTNTGGTTGTTVLSNPVPSRATYSGTGEGWSCASGSAAGTACTQSINVGPGTTVTKTYTATITSTDGVAAITDTVASSAGTCTSCTVSNPTPAQLATTLTISTINGNAATSNTPVKPGDVIVYTASVTDSGGVAGSTLVTNVVPANTTYTGTGEGWSCATGSAANSLCSQTVNVPASGTATNTYTVTAVAPLPSGTKTIDDAITSSVGTCTTCAVSNPTAAILDTTLTLDQVNGTTATPSSTVKAGDKLVYRVATTNTGGSTGTTTLSQTVPANTTFSGIAAQGWSCPSGAAAGTVCTHPNPVSSGATVGFFFQVTVDKPLPNATTTITDTVTTSAGTCSACSVSNAVVATLDTVVVINTVNGQPATASTPLATGDDVVYRIYVDNPNGPAGTVTITDVVPANTTFAGTGWSCALGDPAGTSCTRTVSVPRGGLDVPFEVKVGTLPSGVTTITEAASVSTGTCSACSVSNPTVAQLDTTLQLTSVNGNTAATANTPLKAGDVVVYTVTTTNGGGSPGTTTLGNVVPVNSTYTGSGEGWSCNASNTSCSQDVTVDPASPSTVDVTVTIGAAPAGTKTLTDTTTSTGGTCSACAVTNPTVAALTTTVAIVSVNGQPADATTPVKPGDTIVYSVTVSNSGGVSGSTTISDTVPANTTYTGTGQGWTCTTGATAGTTCTQPVAVASGVDDSLQYTVTVVDPLPANTTSIGNAVTTSNGTCAGCTTSNPTVAVVATTLALATVNGAPATAGVAIAPGDVLGYAVTVTDTGGSPAAVTLGQTVPAQTTYTGTGWTCTGNNCTQDVTATPGTPVVVPFQVTAADPFTSGTQTIKDTVTANVGTCSACSVSNPTVAHLDTALTLATVNGDPYVAGTPLEPGDVLGYQVTVTNTGGSPGTTTITDSVPGNTTYTGTNEGWTCAGGTCTHDVTAPADGSKTIDFTVTVVSPLPPNTTSITNTVTSSDGNCSACSTSAATAGRLDTVLTLTDVDGAPASPGTQIGAGSTLLYTATVTNTGGTAVTTTLTEQVPAHTSYTGIGEGWTCTGSTCTRTVTVAPASSATVEFTVASDSPLPSGVATITDTLTTSTGSCSACTVATPTVALLDTTLAIATVDNAAYVTGTPLTPGDVVGYQVSVANTGGSTGSTTLTEVVPANTVYSGTGWSCNAGDPAGTTCTATGKAASGDTTTTTFQVTVVDPLPDGTKTIVDNVGTSAGTCSSCSVTATVRGALDTVLDVVKVNGAAATAATQVKTGDTIGYRMRVTNTGGATVTTTLTQTVPDHTSYTGSPQEGWTCSDTTPGSTCTQPVAVAGGATEAVIATVTVGTLPADVTTIDDSVTSSTGTCSSCAVSNPTVGTLSVSKRVTAINGTTATNDTAINAGDVVTYTITAINSGGSSATTTLTDTVPVNARYTGSGEGWSCASGSVAGTDCAQQVTVASGGQQDVAFTMTVGTFDDGTGTVANTVTSSAGSCTLCTATSPTVGALRTSKQLVTRNGEPVMGAVHVRSGDVLGYAITVRNAGGSAATTTLTENVPAHTTYTGRREGWTCASATCSQDVAVPALQSVTVRFTATVGTLENVTSRAIVNTVASTTGLCPACQVSTTIARADVSVTKTANRASAAVGDRVTFTVRVRNGGPDDAHAVTVADRPTGLRLVSASAAVGRFDGTTWTVPELAVDAAATLTTVYVVTARTASNVASVTGSSESNPPGAHSVASVGLGDSSGTRGGGTAGTGSKGGGTTSAGGGTAETGFDAGRILGWALLLLTAGAGLLLAVRRRRA